MRLTELNLTCALLITCTCSYALTIIPDYTYDTNNWYDTGKQAVVNSVFNLFSDVITNTFDDLTPSGVNSITYNGWNPSDPFNSGITLENYSFTDNTLVVYLGAGDLGGALGLGGNMGYSASGYSSWITQINNTNTDTFYQPLKGTISLNSSVNWNINSNLNDTSAFADFSAYDLSSVLQHELMHVLGFGLSNVNAWNANLTNDNQFQTASTLVSLSPDNVHLNAGETGLAFNGSEWVLQEGIMVPSLTNGERKWVTDMEWDMLEAMGYTLSKPIPEPGTYSLLLSATALVLALRFKRKLYKV